MKMRIHGLLLGVCLFSPLTLGAAETTKALLPEGAVARYGFPRMTHSEPVRAIRWLPDQKRIATRTQKHLFLWDVETGGCLWHVPLADDTCGLLEHVHPGMLLVSCGPDVCFLDETGKTRHKLRHGPGSAWNAVVSLNGKQLLIVWVQGPSILYDITEQGPQEPGRVIYQGRLGAPQFTADGLTLVGVRHREVEVFDVQPFGVRHTFKPNDAPQACHSARISPDGLTVMAATKDQVHLWKIGQPKEWRTVHLHDKINFSTTAFQFGFTQDSASLVIATPTGDFHRWSTTTGNLTKSLTMSLKAQQTQISSDGTRLAVVQKDELSIWDTNTGKCRIPAKGTTVLFSRFIARDRILSLMEDQSLHWWTLAEGRLLLKRFVRIERESSKWPIVSPDGVWFADVVGRGSIYLLGDLQERRHRDREINVNPLSVAPTFSPDSKELLTVDKNGVWQFWSPENEKLKRHFSAPVPCRVDYAPNGRSIAAYLRANGRIAVYHSQTGKRRFLTEEIHLDTSEVGDLRFSPSGQYLAIAHAKTLCVLSTVYGRVLLRRTIEPGWSTVVRSDPKTGKKDVSAVKQAVAFSPDERWLVVGYGALPNLHLYDLDAACQNDYEPWSIPAHAGGVIELHLSPDGKYLVSTGRDGTSLVWDTKKIFPAERSLIKFNAVKMPGDWWAALRDRKGNDLSCLMTVMVQHPEKTLKVLAERLQPAKPPDAEMLQKWLTQLDSQRFSQRESATIHLAKLGELAEPALLAALKQPASLELKLRVKRLLQRLDEPEHEQERLNQPAPDPERLRTLRSIEVLERIGTPEARAILNRLSQGAHGARQTVEAAEALRRLATRRF